MHRPGWNPTRRNRDLGTAKAGRGQENRMVIPAPAGPVYWEQLSAMTITTRVVHGRAFPLVIEPTGAGELYPCTVDDVAHALGLLPAADVFGDDARGIAGVVLRRPTRKQRALLPVWGRFLYALDVGPISGMAIVLEAQPVPLRLRRPRRADVEDQRELDRLREEADTVAEGRRHVELEFSHRALRSVVLERTLLHEVGHHVHYLEEVERPVAADGDDLDQRWQRFRGRPQREREDFAHRYAAAWGARLRADGAIPFAPRFDRDAWERDGLDPHDFFPADQLPWPLE
ncbi:MAG: hypothetical protein R3B09_04425 [Nannocystaceae bacterium]